MTTPGAAKATGAPTVKTLKVPGATLYYEVRGSGPVLLAIPGGPIDAGVYAQMAEELADRFTVVTYDPRGHSRSTLDGPHEGSIVEQHADDAARLIDAVGGGPAYVLGSSGGATIGLELVRRHAEKVKRLVAHEPPVMEVAPDRARWRAVFQEIYDTYKKDGVDAAMQKFGTAVEEGGPKYSEQQPQGQPHPEMLAMFGRIPANFDFFFEHEIRAIGGYVPDIEALRKQKGRIVIAGGKESGQQGAYRAAVALAERLGMALTYFEGGHGGGGAEDVFAERLDEVLRS